MVEEQGEAIIFENGFGTVTSKRVTYFRKKGWFSGGTREDVPLKHVTSVRHETSRHIIWGIIWTLIGLASIAAGVGFLFLFLHTFVSWDLRR